MTITLKDIFDKIGYGDYGEFEIDKKINNPKEILIVLESVDTNIFIQSENGNFNSFLFWSIVLNPEFCKKVFGREGKRIRGVDYRISDYGDFLDYEYVSYLGDDNIQELEICGSAWIICQSELLKMRNENKSIAEVLKYIEENTILELNKRDEK
jgi:hypothetical protein